MHFGLPGKIPNYVWLLSLSSSRKRPVEKCRKHRFRRQKRDFRRQCHRFRRGKHCFDVENLRFRGQQQCYIVFDNVFDIENVAISIKNIFVDIVFDVEKIRTEKSIWKRH